MAGPTNLESVFAQMRASDVSRWSGVAPRLQERCDPVIEPIFQVPADSRVFTIGSCFARNIEENLAKLGYDLPMLEFDLPQAEKINQRAANIVNKYTPPAVWQEIKWCADVLRRDGIVTLEDCRPFYYELNGLCYDNATHGRFGVTPERMVERRQHIFDVFSQMFSCDCVVITLGLTECFYDKTRDLYVANEIVANPKLRAQLKEHVEFRVLNFSQAQGFLRQSLDLLWELNPNAKVLLTVSPVPLKATFRDEDVVLATAQSKALLRTVISDTIANDPRAAYFPAFERIMLTRNWDVFLQDLRHVSDFAVKGIVAQLTRTYFETDSAKQDHFDSALAPAKDAEGQYNAALLAAQIALEAQDLEDADHHAKIALKQSALNPDINNGELRALRIVDQVLTARSDWVARGEVLARMAELRPHCVAWIKLAYNNYRLQRFDLIQSNLDMAIANKPEDHPTAGAQIEKLSNLLAQATKTAS